MARTKAGSTLASTRVALGPRQNLAQLMLLVGGTLGQERTVLPLLWQPSPAWRSRTSQPQW